MAVKIRLQRHGKKGKPFYWIVAADARAKRDGRYLQKLGTYNPNVNPASINLNVDDAVKWIQFGAQPTNTAKTILSHEGVLLKNHLLNGVKKGAFSEEVAEEKFQAWLSEKQSSVDGKKAKLDKDAANKRDKALQLEKEASDKRKAKAEEALKEEEEVATEEVPAAKEAPATDEAPATEEAPATDEAPAKEEE